MDADRLQRIRTEMAANDLDALVCRLPEHVVLFSGHWPLIGWSFLVLPQTGRPTLICPDCDGHEADREAWEADVQPFRFGVLDADNPHAAIASRLKDASNGKGWRHIGFEGRFETVAPPWNAAEPAVPAGATADMLEAVFGRDRLVDVSDLLNAQRACKTAGEADKLRLANTIASFGLGVFRERVNVGTSGIELVAAVESEILLRGTGQDGAKRVRAFAQVATGNAETAIGHRPMLISSARPLVDGELALLELAVVVDGFWSDRTRVHVAGRPNPRQEELHALVRNAQEAAVEAIRPGVTAGDVDEAARAVIRDGGMADAFIHVTGHGIGLRYHEPSPVLLPNSPEVLHAGMVTSVEPGIYDESFGGVRIEDNILVTDTGAEVLGPSAKELR